jgi:glutamine synthetase type III
MFVKKLQTLSIVAMMLHYSLQSMMQLVVSQGDVLQIVVFNVMSLIGKYTISSIQDSVGNDQEYRIVNVMAMTTFKISMI